MKKLLLTFLVGLLLPATLCAQRFTDKLDRGLVAMKSGANVYLSWRILGEEYYDVEYNVYRNGTKLNSTPLKVSNFTDNGGSTSNEYTVAPVVKGVEQAQSKAVKPWTSSYKQINLKHEGIASTLVPNDACCADVDGDGELEFLMKFDNLSEMTQSYPKAGPTVNGKVTGEYSIFEVFKMDGTRLWWVNCGPNMGDFQNNEQNIVGYDWNQDGKAEVLMRLEEGSTIHYADGTTYTIGANGQNGGSWNNYRGATGGGTNWFMCVGKEFLVYCDGETGKVYDIIDYPLARLEAGETSLEAAWGDGYGHRASKFFFGAPYLDGKNPSIFLARGIYTQIKMCAFDVNKATNKLVKRWDWRQKNGGYWMWQGYHNFGIADVDMDGRDEICYGSMVIDDNGKGLSTTGLGHGDAQHCGDFNPFIHGLEIYACNEDQPGNNYRDATTSKLYHRFNSGNDDGRAMMDNFSDQWPGAIGCSAREGAISSVYNEAVPGMGTTGINTNFRIYWDGDLCSETFNYQNGKNTAGVVAKYGSWNPIYVAEGSITNNDTKGTPCYQGDILGDWREEMVMRTADNNIRIYSTPTPTTYRVPTLWSDHQYRNAMVWQMCGYNQPPHISYFLGKMEGITQAPPPLTTTGRVVVNNGGTVSSSLNGKHALVCETSNSNIVIENGVSPDVLTFNVPSWVQGTAGTNYTAKEATIKYEYYTCNVTGGALTGGARLVKQGDGVLNLPKVDMTHTGATDVWEGEMNFDGTMKNSDLWLNRFTKLRSNGGQFKSIGAQYDAKIYPGGEDNVGEIVVDSMYLDYGSRVVIDFNGTNHDVIKAKQMTLIKKTGDAWVKYGPQFVQPVLEINGKDLVAGDYVIMEVENLKSPVLNFKLVGTGNFKTGLKYENGKVILSLGDTRGASNVVWTGVKTSTWDKAITENFVLEDDVTATPDVFVNEDAVTFNDNATRTSINLAEEVTVSKMTFDNVSKEIVISGTGSVVSGSLVKNGNGVVTINTLNKYTDGNELNAGVTKVSKLSNSIDEAGNLGGVMKVRNKFNMSNGAILNNTEAVTNGSVLTMVGDKGGVIQCDNTFTQEGTLYGTMLTKSGSGTLNFKASGSLSTFHAKSGIVDATSKIASKVIASGKADLRGSGFQNTPIEVSADAEAALTTINRATTNLALTGTGKISVWCATEKGSTYYATRTPIQLNMSNFEGIVEPHAVYAADGRFTFDTSSGGTAGKTKWTLNIPTGVIVQNSGKTLSIGKLTGVGQLGGGCAFSNGVTVPANTWNIGNETDFTFEGICIGGDSFFKVGTGKMTIKGVWTNTSTTRVKEGALVLNSAASPGTGALIIDKGAMLRGASTGVKNSSVTINGELFPGTTDLPSTGNMVFNNQNVTISNTGILHLTARKASTETGTTIYGVCVKNIAKLTVNGKIIVDLTSAYISPKVGDFIRLWTGVQTLEGNYTVECGNNKRIYFDSSRLAKDGLLQISRIVELGDVDEDGVVTKEDANIVVRYFLGLSVPAINLSAADVNGDGKITMADANAILNIAMKK